MHCFIIVALLCVILTVPYASESMPAYTLKSISNLFLEHSPSSGNEFEIE